MPAQTYSIDLVDGAQLQKQRQDSTGLIVASATRIALVKGMSGSPALALAAARKLVEADVPIGTLYDPTDPTIPYCMATGYRSIGLTGTIARVEILYDTPQFNPREGQPLIISDDTTEVPDKLQFDPATGKQLSIFYVDPNDANKKVKFFPEIPFPSLMRVVVLTGIVAASDLIVYQSLLRSVNDGPWLGINGVAYWRFTRVHTQYTRQSRYLLMTAECKTWIEKDWSVYEFLRDPASGRIVSVRGNDLANAQKRPYAFGVIDDTHAGFIRIGPYRTTNFPALFKVA